jgi:hypothetical protein
MECGACLEEVPGGGARCQDDKAGCLGRDGAKSVGVGRSD